MISSAYEKAIFDRHANDDTQPLNRNKLKEAEAVIGIDNIRREPDGKYRIWHMGRYGGKLGKDDLIREANVRLKALGKPQITGDPRWRV